MQLVEKNLGLSNPISSAEFYVLVEISGSHERHDREKLDGFLERVMEEGCVSDGTVAQDWSKIHAVWALRERIAEALNAEGAVYKVIYLFPNNFLTSLTLWICHGSTIFPCLWTSSMTWWRRLKVVAPRKHSALLVMGTLAMETFISMLWEESTLPGCSSSLSHLSTTGQVAPLSKTIAGFNLCVHNYWYFG